MEFKQPPDTESKRLSPDDIKFIRESFLKRTNWLEPNIQLKSLPQIYREYEKRFLSRYIRPSKFWYETLWLNNDTKPPFNKLFLNNPLPDSISKKQLLNFDYNDLAKTPLKIRDLAILRATPSELSMCVQLPESVEDPRYTFASRSGKLYFVYRSMIKIRIPYQVPKGIQGLILKELQHEFSPIGTLKSNTKDTFILPYLARNLLSRTGLSDINKAASYQRPIVMKKLELLHRYLQNDKGPTSIPFTHLINLVNKLDLSQALHLQAGNDYIINLIKEANDPPSIMNASLTIAVYWSLVELSETFLWDGINRNSASLFPTTVTVLPLLSYRVHYTELIEDLERNNYKQLNKFSNLVNDKNYQEIEQSFSKIINLLQEYTAGNLQNNPKITTLISKLFRGIKEYQRCDITRDLCNELLMKFPSIKPNSNPLLKNHDLATRADSQHGQRQQILYDYVKPNDLLIQESLRDRFDFGDLRVYCIDSETAHEIDDGISIEKKFNGKFTLHIHIADPAIFFPECNNEKGVLGLQDDVLKIAYENSFTTYLPDTVVPMLPKSYCKMADLGINGKKTPSISFSVDVILNKEKSNLKICYDTFQIRLGLVSNFPKATYDNVDDILSSEVNSEQKLLQDDLRQLSMIAGILRNKRTQENGAITFGEGFNRGTPKYSEDSETESDVISFVDQKNTKSNELVTELMILANTLCGRYFKENKIFGVYRCYNDLNLEPKAKMQYNKLREECKNGKLPTLEDIVKVQSLLNSSYYSEHPSRHDMIGSEQYLTVTSPLRRFTDLVSHIQLHNHLKGHPLPFNQKAIRNFVPHIQSRADKLRKISTESNVCMTLSYLKNLLKTKPDTMFDVKITSVPSEGRARCLIPEYSFARGEIRLSPSLKVYPKVGDTVNSCKVVKISCVDGILEFNK